VNLSFRISGCEIDLQEFASLLSTASVHAPFLNVKREREREVEIKDNLMIDLI
jgi:hypothetical protein